MMQKIAIDFGTSNSVIARWNPDTASSEVMTLPEFSTDATAQQPSVIPSLLYVDQAIAIGRQVLDANLHQRQSHRLFRSFKRGIVGAAPKPRLIDGQTWTDRDAGQRFLDAVINALPTPKDIEQLILTAPVSAFQNYIDWLGGAMRVAPEQIRVVDESTAAALGYTVTQPGATVLVFDFGGGTLDLSLVQLPERPEKTGGFLNRLIGSGQQHSARVIAKSGRLLGGSDIDQWLLIEVLRLIGKIPEEVGDLDYAALLTQCEAAKIALSSSEITEIAFTPNHHLYCVTFTRTDLEKLLEKNGFTTALRRAVDQVMYLARQAGVFKEDIQFVLMVGGMSLIPMVQYTLADYFPAARIQSHKPFTAVAEGALRVAAGYGLEDTLIHSYGLRYLENSVHHFDEIIPMGSAYPSSKAVEVRLGASRDNQTEIELIIGELDSGSTAMIEVQYEHGQAVFVAQPDQDTEHVLAINENQPLILPLNPPGIPGEDRIKAAFTVDMNRRLRVTVTDLKTRRELIKDSVVTNLR